MKEICNLLILNYLFCHCALEMTHFEYCWIFICSPLFLHFFHLSIHYMERHEYLIPFLKTLALICLVPLEKRNHYGVYSVILVRWILDSYQLYSPISPAMQYHLPPINVRTFLSILVECVVPIYWGSDFEDAPWSHYGDYTVYHEIHLQFKMHPVLPAWPECISIKDITNNS